MSATRRRFAQEFKDELCREVISTSKPIKEVARAYGVGPETSRNWLHKYREAHGGTDNELSVPERARLKQLESENQELLAETAFLKKRRPTSRGNNGDGQIRVRRLPTRRAWQNGPFVEDVPLVGRLLIRFLPLAGPPPVGHQG
jgi:transposase